jgi:hypothetical protein
MAISSTSFFLNKNKNKNHHQPRARAREKKIIFCFGVIKPKGLGPRARGNKKPFQPMKDWKGLERIVTENHAETHGKFSASVLFRGRRF